METQTERKRFLDSLVLPLFWVATMWTIHLFSVLSDYDLYEWGVLPRVSGGLVGIFTAPFIHGDFQHLLSNTVPLLMLSWTINYFYREIALPALSLIYLLTGLCVWFFAREVYHIGASGVVYGLVAFVFWSGWLIKDVRAVALGLIVTVLYSGMFFGVLPNQEGISWESHLFGALVGLGVAIFMQRKIIKSVPLRRPKTVETLPKNYFLPRDAFAATKEERKRASDWAYFYKENEDYTRFPID